MMLSNWPHKFQVFFNLEATFFQTWNCVTRSNEGKCWKNTNPAQAKEIIKTSQAQEFFFNRVGRFLAGREKSCWLQVASLPGDGNLVSHDDLLI